MLAVDTAQGVAKDFGIVYTTKHDQDASDNGKEVILDIAMEDDDQMSIKFIGSDGNETMLWFPLQRIRQLLIEDDK